MKSILVVDDDADFRTAVALSLEQKGYKVSQAQNGKIAQDMLIESTPDLVVSDIQMPVLGGIELLNWSKENRPIPFLLMTGFALLLETQTAYTLGARDFIAKPFKNTELTDAVDRIFGVKEAESTGNQFVKVRLEEFISQPRIVFDVYIKLSDTKYVKISRKGDELDRERIQQYRDKGLKYLYITKS